MPNTTTVGITLEDGFIQVPEIAAPATPATGFGRFYFKADGILYFKDDAGTETACGGGVGGGLSEAEVLGRLCAAGF